MKVRLIPVTMFLFLLTCFFLLPNETLLALDPQPEPPMRPINIDNSANIPPLDTLDPQPEPPMRPIDIEKPINLPPLDALDPQPEPPMRPIDMDKPINIPSLDALDPQPEPPMIAKDIKILINGVPLDTLDPQPEPPMLYQDRTLVPLRSIFESLGAEVEWEGTTKTITLKKGTTIIIMRINVGTATINGQTVNLDVPPLLYNDRTFVPLRFVSQALGNEVGWNDQTRTVSINAPLAK